MVVANLAAGDEGAVAKVEVARPELEAVEVLSPTRMPAGATWAAELSEF